VARKRAGSGAEGIHCLISGGETTVKVTGPGQGGRNQELALAFAVAIEGLEGVTLLSAATDGTDGPTDAAGAIVDGRTAATARSLGIDPIRYLADNDSYSFFQHYDARSGEKSHIVIGPTGTNVMDIQIMAVGGTGRTQITPRTRIKEARNMSRNKRRIKRPER
jgi:glycerate-2-kinase